MVKNNWGVLAVLLIFLIIIAPISLAYSDVYVGGGVNAPKKEESSDPGPAVPLQKPGYINGMKAEDYYEIQVAAGVGAYKGWQEAQSDPGFVENFLLGKPAAKTYRDMGAASSGSVERNIRAKIREAAEQRGVSLSPKQEEAFFNYAYEKIQPSAMESFALYTGGTAHAAAEMLGIFAIANQAGNIVYKGAPGLVKDFIYTTESLIKGDTGAAAARALTAATMVVLPGVGGKLARTKILRPLAQSAQGWLDGAPEIIANSPELQKYLLRTGKKGVKVSVKQAYMLMIALGENPGMSDSKMNELGVNPDVEFYKFYYAKTDEWTDLSDSVGEEGFEYMKTVDASGQLLLYGKDKETGFIQRQNPNGGWSKVKPGEVSFGSEIDKYNQAPWGKWGIIDAGQSGWLYRRVPKEEGSDEYVLYGLGPSNELIKQNEDNTWSELTKQERISYSSVIRAEEAAKDMRLERLADNLRNIDEELPTTDESYDFKWGFLYSEDEEDYDGLELEYESGEGAELIYGGDLSGEATVNIGGVVMSVDEYSRRYELKQGYTGLKDLLTRPSEDLRYDFKWTLGGKEFRGEITITTADGEKKTVTFSRPGSFLQVLGDVEDLGLPSDTGSTIQATKQKLAKDLANNGWEKEGEKDKQLAFRDRSAPGSKPLPDKPVSICSGWDVAFN